MDNVAPLIQGAADRQTSNAKTAGALDKGTRSKHIQGVGEEEGRGEDQRARDEDEGQREEQGEERQRQERAKTTPGCEVGGEEGEGKESRVEMGEESNKRPAGPIESP